MVLPGLINMHCHAGDSLFRGLVENLPLEEWLKRVWIAEKAILTPHNLSWLCSWLRKIFYRV